MATTISGNEIELSAATTKTSASSTSSSTAATTTTQHQQQQHLSPTSLLSSSPTAIYEADIKQQQQQHKQQHFKFELIQKPQMEIEEEELLENVTFPSDDIPEPIKVLDDIISEFEDTSLRPQLQNSNSGSGGGENQSEDDGYMSLSRKNMKEKRDSEEMSQTSSSCAPLVTPNESFDAVDLAKFETNGNCKVAELEEQDDLATPTTTINDNFTDPNDLQQTTLPKAKTATTNSNYSSLPCCGQRNANNTLNEAKLRVGSCNGERNALGIDISAVHKAVLRGRVAKLPEPMLNEHPITIYPGPRDNASSGAGGGGVGCAGGNGAGNKRNNRPKRLVSSVEKHKELCHILNPNSTSISSSSSSSSPPSTGTSSGGDNHTKHSSSSNNTLDKSFKNTTTDDDDDDEDDNDDNDITDEDSVDDDPSGITISSESTLLSSRGIAWEIHFKDFKRKTKQYREEAKRKNAAVNSKQGHNHRHRQGGSSSSHHHHHHHNHHNKYEFKKSHRDASNSKSHYLAAPVANVACTEEEFRSFEESPEIQNACVYRHSSMLGKGTFIIRRGSTKKPPRAMDIFSNYDDIPVRHGLSESEPDVDSETERVKYILSPPKMEMAKENHRAGLEIKEAYTRHSLDRVKPITSPRERLSLNIEPMGGCAGGGGVVANVTGLHNSLKKDHSPIQQHLSKLGTEVSKKGSLKSLESRASSESVNVIRTPGLDEAGGYDMGAKAGAGAGEIDPKTIFVYKQNVNNVLIQAEYNDLRSTTTTPHTDLAPTLEEDEEQLSDMSYSCAPLKQIENNISALLRGDMSVVRLIEVSQQPPPPPQAKRPLEFRPGVHKSESAKEMILSKNAFGPLPPSPPSPNADAFDYNDLPLPPSPTHPDAVDTSDGEDQIKPPATSYIKTSVEVHTQSMPREEMPPPPAASHQRSKERERSKERDKPPRPVHRHMSDELPLPPPPPPPSSSGQSQKAASNIFEHLPPAIPPHRNGGHSANTMKSWSIDSNYKRRSPRTLGYGGSGVTTPTSSHGQSYEVGTAGGTSMGSGYGTRRYVSYGTKRSLKQSPREEHRLQTSCSLPETPIFARGCDIPRTPYRRQNENTPSGSRTAPRSSTSNNINMGNSIVGITSGSGTFGGAMCRQRSINHALASNEMLRMAGAPQRGWYPKQRNMRPVSTENIDRLNTMRAWDGTAMSASAHARKPLTLPPNLTPSFLNKSPRDALRRVTSLLITKKKSKEKDKRSKSAYTADHAIDASHYYQDIDKANNAKDSKRNQTSSTTTATGSSTAEKPKKKGIFKTLWKRTKHASLDHQ